MDSSVVSLKNRQEIADGTMAFHLERPPGFYFKAGQALDVTLLNPTEMDPEGNSRAFSIVSPPYADDLVVATRMRDTPFKRFLRTAPLGTPVKIDGPSGSFTLHNNHVKPAVFLAGGIGITPFLSILRQAGRDKLPHSLYLFYSNRRPEDAAFLEDLEALERQNAGFHLVATMTQMEKSSREWKGELGKINREMVAKRIPALQGPIYYIAGPSAMVTGIRHVLVGAGVDQDDIRTEEFAGY